MTPEHSQRVKQLLQSALERKPNERSAFLAEVCTGDESLRKDVEALIISHELAGSLIEEPAVAGIAEVVANNSCFIKQSKPAETVRNRAVLSGPIQGPELEWRSRPDVDSNGRRPQPIASRAHACGVVLCFQVLRERSSLGTQGSLLVAWQTG